jgi:hypothetical protein
MQLPSIREKIFSLPRSLKILLPILFILVLVIAIEGSYYLWISIKKAEESKFIDTSVLYQEGVFSYNKVTKEPIAIRGWITKIDGLVLTIKSQEQEVIVKINSNFSFAEIVDQPKEKTSTLEVNGQGEENILKEAEKRGLLKDAIHPGTNDLSQLVSIGDLVVISDLRPESGGDGLWGGGVLSVLRWK